MLKFKTLKFKSSATVRIGLTCTIAALGIPLSIPSPAQANPYNACAKDLSNAKLDQVSIGKGCAEALHPDTVGTCVARITGPTVNPITAVSALDACRQVRRPLELATCVNDIRNSDETQAPMMDVLDACRRSLLPERFGQCVVGFRNAPLERKISEGLVTCLDATDYRKDVILRPLSDLINPYIPAPQSSSVQVTPVLPTIQPTPQMSPTPKISPTPQLF
ncbi:MAG: hypothetical protein LH631_01595 [Alkalinema sp. CAN_BIN05]|nr:hypothetical protein [Alkalinema sp. CAN_BIN05]